MGIILYPLVSTANPHCVQEPLQFYSWLVCCSTMLFMSVSTQSHVHCFVNALNDLKILVICSCSFQDNQEFSPTATQLCKFISGTAHQNFILRTHGTLLQGLHRSNLVLADDHNLSSWSHQQLIYGSFLLAGSWKKWKTLAYVTLLQDTVSYPYGHFYYDFT